MNPGTFNTWGMDWAWGIPLIVLTVIFQASGLGLIDNRPAMLYSPNAITSYCHADIDLAAKWQLRGALEALNGWILSGLTAAFLFTKMQKAWPHT